MADAQVLVVDADAARCKACVAVLRGLGLGVDACATPVGAMGRLVNRTQPLVTALVVAGDLPGMGPVLMIRAARSLPGRADLPVVVVGGGDLDMPTRCRRIATTDATTLGDVLTALAAPAIATTDVAPRVLVVDDHEVNRIILVKTIEARGIRVDTAVDGIDALARIGRQHYALVFMDVEMPRMDGLEATRAIRRLEQDKGRRTPIIACTSRNQSGDRETGLVSGMDDYLVKPVAVAQIEAQVERWLGVRRQAAPAASAPLATSSAPAVEQPLLDTTVLDRIKGYGPEVLANTAGKFIDELDGRIVELERLLAAGSCVDLHRQAHGLKGVSGSLGAKRLWQAMGAIEAAGHAHDLVQAGELLSALRPLIDDTKRAMRAAMDG